MKNTIIGIIIGIVLSLPLLATAKEKLNIVKITDVGHTTASTIFTTKIMVEEGTYRIFLLQSYYGKGITAVKIDD